MRYVSLGCFIVRNGCFICWRYLLPIFWNSGRTNYVNEVLYQHDNALLPMHAAQLLHSRFIMCMADPERMYQLTSLTLSVTVECKFTQVEFEEASSNLVCELLTARYIFCQVLQAPLASVGNRK